MIYHTCINTKRKENIMNVKIIVLSCWAIIEELREAQLPVIISSAERVHIVIIARTSSLGYHVVI